MPNIVLPAPLRPIQPEPPAYMVQPSRDLEWRMAAMEAAFTDADEESYGVEDNYDTPPANPLRAPRRSALDELMEAAPLRLQRSRSFRAFLENLTTLIDCCIAITGRTGEGKSMMAVSILHNIMYWCKIPVVIVGANPEYRESFLDGVPDYVPRPVLLTEAMFVDELYQLAEITEEIRRQTIERINAGQASDGWEAEYMRHEVARRNLHLANAFVWFDESFNMFNSARAHDNLNEATSAFLMQRRHLGLTLLFTLPVFGKLPPVVRENIHWRGRPAFLRGYNPLRIETQFFDPMGMRSPFSLSFIVEKYMNMYNTHSAPSFNFAILKKALRATGAE